MFNKHFLISKKFVPGEFTSHFMQVSSVYWILVVPVKINPNACEHFITVTTVLIFFILVWFDHALPHVNASRVITVNLPPHYHSMLVFERLCSFCTY